MKLLGVALAVLSSSVAAEDGGQPRVLDVELAHIVQSDGGALDVTGGAWLRDDVVMARAREFRAAEAMNAALKDNCADAPPPPPASGVTVMVVLTASLIVFAGGLVTGILVAGGR